MLAGDLGAGMPRIYGRSSPEQKASLIAKANVWRHRAQELELRDEQKSLRTKLPDRDKAGVISLLVRDRPFSPRSARLAEPVLRPLRFQLSGKRAESSFAKFQDHDTRRSTRGSSRRFRFPRSKRSSSSKNSIRSGRVARASLFASNMTTLAARQWSGGDASGAQGAGAGLGRRRRPCGQLNDFVRGFNAVIHGYPDYRVASAPITYQKKRAAQACSLRAMN